MGKKLSKSEAKFCKNKKEQIDNNSRENINVFFQRPNPIYIPKNKKFKR